MRVIRQQAIQVHPVPDKITPERGPFPRELFDEPEIVYADPAYSEDGTSYLPGATVQNNYKPVKYLRCVVCDSRVLESETSLHICEG
jgi:hypothetical protein